MISHSTLTRSLVVFALLAAACSQGNDDLTGPTQVPASSADARASALMAAAGVCDFNPTETTLTGPGWTRVFDENFSSNLTQWNAWYGGAFNEELQLYQAANLQVANGLLGIAARKETVTGPATPWDATPRSFSYSSGRIESKAYFSASRTTPKVRLSARLKLPSGFGM